MTLKAINTNVPDLFFQFVSFDSLTVPSIFVFAPLQNLQWLSLLNQSLEASLDVFEKHQPYFRRPVLIIMTLIKKCYICAHVNIPL